MAMVRTITVKLEPLTPEAFKPFGQVMSNASSPYQGTASQTWRFACDLEGTPDLAIVRVPFVPWKFHLIQRHPITGHSAFSLDGKPSLLLVAPPTDPDDRESLPPPEDFKAFLVEGRQGVMLRRGAWHISHVPLYPPSGDFVVLTSAELRDDAAGAQAAGKAPALSQFVDYRDRMGVTFQITW